MKKFIIAIAFMVASVAQAASVTVEYEDRTGDKGSADSSNYAVRVKEKINSNFAGDIQFKQFITDGTGAIKTRLEGGLTGSYAVYQPFTLYTRVGVGNKFIAGDDFMYYSVEPGVVVSLTDNLSTKFGYRYRTAFDSSKADTSDTWRASATYALTKKDAVTLGFDHQRGDSNNHTVKFGYTRDF